MNFALLNQSRTPGLDAAALMAIAAALTRQLCECYVPLWEAGGGTVFVVESLAEISAGAIPVVILADADQAGALGYHSTTPDGRPYARVFTGVIMANGGSIQSGPTSVSAVISHEVLETIGDPYASWWADGDDGQSYALELADPVENDSYEIDGVAVSNFVGPRWFSGGPGPYDWMGRLSAPFAMTVGGYLIVRTASGDVRQIWGDEYPAWRRAAKQHPTARTARRRSKPAAAA